MRIGNRPAIFAILFCIVFPAAWTPVRAGVDDLGLLELFKLDQVTVVYPSAPSAEAERNRLSAERKAVYLTRTRGVPAKVISDAEARREDLKGNLLLLGWSNRLLNRFKVETPFGRSSVSIRFLDYIDEQADLDLAFVGGSPFADPKEGKKLFFWSRIDKDRDRFMPLPSTGSDWAFFEDYIETAQGFLDHSHYWPLRRKPEAERRINEELMEYRRTARALQAGRYRLHWDPAAVSDSKVEAIGAARNAALAKALQRIPSPDKKFVIDLFLYPDAETKRTLTGIKAGAHQVGRPPTVHMTVQYAESDSFHEEIHYLAGKILGATASTAAYEGLSFAFEPRLQGQPLAFFVALMIDRGDPPTLAGLLDEPAFAAMPKESAYSSAGLLMAWLLEKKSLSDLKPWYAADRPNLDALARMLGISPEKAEREFHDRVLTGTKPFSGDVAFVRAQEEARDAHMNGDYEGLAAALRKALQYHPNDWQTRFNLASAVMRLQDYATAEKELRAIMASELPDGHTLKIFAHLQLGRVFDLAGRREEALEEYRKVLALPDVHDSHISAREDIRTPFTKERLQ